MADREILCQGYDISKSGAIICKHVGRQGLLILVAIRDEPIDPVDTGWQFHCGIHDYDGSDGELWCVMSVVKHDSTVECLLDNPPEVKFVRDAQDAPWEVSEYGGFSK